MRPAHYRLHADTTFVHTALFVRFHADQLFAAFGILGSVCIAMAGHCGGAQQAHDSWLSASGMISVAGELILLGAGGKGCHVAGPFYCLASLAMMASGLGLAGLSSPSAGEVATGLLVTFGAVFVFYGDRIVERFRPPYKISGARIGAMFYNISCIPLLIGGWERHSPFECLGALAYCAGDIAIALKRKAVRDR